MKKYIIISILLLQSFVLSADYPDFEVLVNSNPYQEDIFINSSNQNHQFMAILSPDLSVKWYITDINNKGWDFKVGQLVDMLEEGVIDPTKVTRCALQNAASAVGALITSGYAIVED